MSVIPGRLAVRAVALLAVAVALVAMTAGTALGAQVHHYTGQFGGPGGAPGDIAYLAGLGVDEAGNVYVSDGGNARVQVFDAGGEPTAQLLGSATPYATFFGVAGVDGDAGANRVYVVDQWANTVYVYTTTGTYVGELDATAGGGWGYPAGVTVDDATGDVYVANGYGGNVLVFDDTGTYKSTIGSPGADPGTLSSPTSIAVDGNGNVYVVDNPGVPRVQVFTTAGAYVSTLGVESPTAVAVDPSNDDLYVTQTSPAPQVLRYSDSGTLLETFGAGRVQSPIGIGVNPTSHRVYVGDQGTGSVLHFSLTTAPDVTTGGASGITADSATVDGTVNPQGYSNVTGYFEYGLDTSYGSGPVGYTSLPNSTSDEPISTVLSGLQPNQTYHYRAGAFTPFGDLKGADATFTTDAAPPVVGAQPGYATAITSDAAALHGFVNPNNSPTTYRFEYGTTTGYGTTVTVPDPINGFGDQDVTVSVSNLEPDTTYHFRVVADNGVGGEVVGPDTTFTTASDAPPTATDVTGVSAVLNGTIAPGGPPRTYRFEYGETTGYGQATDETSAGSDSAAKDVSAVLTELTPGTTYHFRLVTTVGSSTTYSADATFTTSPAPVAVTGEPTNVTHSGATLNGTVDTHGLPGTYRFVVEGIGNPVSRSTPEQPVTGDGPVAVSAAIGDLPDASKYTVRLVATVAGAEDRGDAVALETPKAPALVPGPVPRNDNPYGCVTPVLTQPSLPAAAGQAYTLTGSDLGVGGRVTIAGVGPVRTTGWTAGAITIEVPTDVSGALTISVDCGKGSNAVTLTVPKPPSNAFSILKVKTKKNSTRAVITVKVPGAGTILAGGSRLKSASRTATKAGTYRLTVRLSAKGKVKLRKAKHHRLRVGIAVRFTPTGGTAATRHATARFTRSAAKAKSKR